MNELFTNIKFRWLIATLFVVVIFEVLSFFSVHSSIWIEFPLFLAVIILFGKRVFLQGMGSLLRLNFSDINLLMTIAVFGALYLRQLEEAAIIVVLFALGETLEEFGIERSQTALRKLAERAPKSARIKEKEAEVPIENVDVGEIMIIKPGDQIPLDGEVVSGSSLVDEASITGEPLPISKYVGDAVYAGTINTQGYLEVKVTKKAKDSTLAKIIELTFTAAEKKAESHKFIERFAGIYTPSIVFTALLLILIPVVLLGKPLDPWLTQALTLLIIACPCALVISTPVAIFSAVGNATRKGVLIKGGKFIEEIGKIKAIAFDKTRTLTKGEPVVSDVVPFNGFTEEEVIACAAGIEAFSEHPIAKSILDKSKDEGTPVHEYKDFRAIPGKGLKGECMVCIDKHHCVGHIKFVTEEHHAEEAVLKKAEELEAQGKTAIVMSDNKRIKGIIGIADEIREESKPLIDELLKMKIVPVILTGDNKTVAGFVASHLGIEVVKAELLPGEKAEEMSKLIQQYGHVAMVGDGVNDAPALASASVGIAMGAIGSDVAIENADIALMNDKLSLLPYLIGLGKACTGKIKSNIVAAVTVKFLFLFLAIAGLSNLALAIFADVGVTVLVIINSLRLFGYEDK
ncbi:MAG: cation-translocating P-type ATPase [Deltaproteobacteria bacterium]|nr:cation-translocating P-type ATPase [Deltaproteobacteria bacterium]